MSVGSTRTRAAGSCSSYFNSYLRQKAGALTLVLIGNSILDIPQHPRIRHLGFLDDTDKFDAIAGAELLIMPSFFESLSMVALEAWALGRPVLANAKCDVLKGQCIRSNAGLYYDSEAEFVETLRAIEFNKWIAGSLGKNGRQYYRDNYDWPVVERKYLDMLQRLAVRLQRVPLSSRYRAGWSGARRTARPPHRSWPPLRPGHRWLRRCPSPARSVLSVHLCRGARRHLTAGVRRQVGRLLNQSRRPQARGRRSSGQGPGAAR